MKSRIRIICILLLLLALSGVAGCYIFFSMIKSNVERAYTARVAADIHAAKEEQVRLVKSTLDEIAPDIQSLSSRLVDTEGTIAIIENIESLGKSAGVEVKLNSVSVKGSDPKSKDAKSQKTENLLLSLGVSGSWNKIYTFVKIMEHLPYKTSIQSVSVNYMPAEKSSAWNGTFSISILKNKPQ